jgi:hypothetical protein
MCILSLALGKVPLARTGDVASDIISTILAIILIAVGAFSLVTSIAGSLGLVTMDLLDRNDARSAQIDSCREYVDEHYTGAEKRQLLKRAHYSKDTTNQISIMLLGTMWTVVLTAIAMRELLIPYLTALSSLFGVLVMPLLTYVVAERAVVDGVVLEGIAESISDDSDSSEK